MRARNFIDTARLYLRPFSLQDAQAAFRIFGSAEAMEFISGGPDKDVEVTRKRLLRYEAHQREHGFSKWAVFAQGELVGDAGLMWLPDHSEVELGYRFSPESWGRGFATEVGTAWLRFAFYEVALPGVIAFADPRNEASIRVMKKLGMRYREMKHLFGVDSVVYVREAPPTDIRT